jgi:hypothetical protein
MMKGTLYTWNLLRELQENRRELMLQKNVEKR